MVWEQNYEHIPRYSSLLLPSNLLLIWNNPAQPLSRSELMLRGNVYATVETLSKN